MRRAIAIVTLCLIVWVGLPLLILAAPQTQGTQVSVLTQHNDNSRTGANLNETILNTSNVNMNQFGKLFSRTVQGHIYAQPLYVPNLTMPGVGVRNVVYIATMHNEVYAFDADDPAASTPFWEINLGPSAPTPSSDFGTNCGTYRDISVEVGIISTPVIDPATSTIYVVALTKEGTVYKHKLHALDMLTGLEKTGSPVQVQGSVNGPGGTITFNSQQEIQRASLLLSNGVIYFSFAGYCDTQPYYGWIFGYDAATLQRTAIYSSTSGGSAGGIWQAGQGISADSAGHLYVMTGNGTFDGNTGGPDLGDSFIQLNPSGATLNVVDWFTPYNQANLDQADLDLGSSGPLLMPGTNLVVGGGKEGKLYVLDRSNMGHFHSGSDSQIVQSFTATLGFIYGSPIYWNSPTNGPLIYVWSARDRLKAFRYNTGTGLFTTTAIMTSTMTVPNGLPGAMLSLSSNGSTAGTGIVWGSHPTNNNANQMVVTGTLRAFNASNLSSELWNSRMNVARDDFGNFPKFASPTIANGKVYMPTFSGRLVVYGLLPTPTPTSTVTSTATNTPTLTQTPTITRTSTQTFTPTTTRTPTVTETPSATYTPSNTPTDTATRTSTGTNTPTLTPTNTPTDTRTPTNTPTDTPTNTPTDTPTETPISGPSLVGHVVWEGIPQPDPRNMTETITITLRLSSGGPPIEYASTNTDASGYFTVSIDLLPAGSYNYRVKGPRNLANCGHFMRGSTIITATEMGVMRAGDADNNNAVGVLDFNILRGSFGRSFGQSGYDSRADFNNDDVITSGDFNLLRGSFGYVGCVGP